MGLDNCCKNTECNACCYYMGTVLFMVSAISYVITGMNGLTDGIHQRIPISVFTIEKTERGWGKSGTHGGDVYFGHYGRCVWKDPGCKELSGNLFQKTEDCETKVEDWDYLNSQQKGLCQKKDNGEMCEAVDVQECVPNGKNLALDFLTWHSRDIWVSRSGQDVYNLSKAGAAQFQPPLTEYYGFLAWEPVLNADFDVDWNCSHYDARKEFYQRWKDIEEGEMNALTSNSTNTTNQTETASTTKKYKLKMTSSAEGLVQEMEEREAACRDAQHYYEKSGYILPSGVAILVYVLIAIFMPCCIDNAQVHKVLRIIMATLCFIYVALGATSMALALTAHSTNFKVISTRHVQRLEENQISYAYSFGHGMNLLISGWVFNVLAFFLMLPYVIRGQAVGKKAFRKHGHWKHPNQQLPTWGAPAHGGYDHSMPAAGYGHPMSSPRGSAPAAYGHHYAQPMPSPCSGHQSHGAPFSGYPPHGAGWAPAFHGGQQWVTSAHYGGSAPPSGYGLSAPSHPAPISVGGRQYAPSSRE